MDKNLSLHCGLRLEKYIVDIWEDTVLGQVRYTLSIPFFKWLWSFSC